MGTVDPSGSSGRCMQYQREPKKPVGTFCQFRLCGKKAGKIKAKGNYINKYS
jgi:hypothetical protein